MTALSRAARQAPAPVKDRLRTVARQDTAAGSFVRALAAGRRPSIRRPLLRAAPGRYATARDVLDAPVVVVLAVGLSDQDLDRAVRAVALEQLVRPGTVPVFLTDRTPPEPVVGRGYSWESVPGWRQWEALGTATAWHHMISERLALVEVLYGASRLVVVPAPDPTTPQGAVPAVTTREAER